MRFDIEQGEELLSSHFRVEILKERAQVHQE